MESFDWLKESVKMAGDFNWNGIDLAQYPGMRTTVIDLAQYHVLGHDLVVRYFESLLILNVAVVRSRYRDWYIVIKLIVVERKTITCVTVGSACWILQHAYFGQSRSF